MFDAPADAWYVWLGVALASVAVAGVALELPSTPPPDANAAANAIDRVAASPYPASATYEHDADEVRIDERRISLRNEAGTAHASVATGDLVPVRGNHLLEQVLHGTHPSVAFHGQFDQFKDAVEAARAEARENPEWRPANGRLLVRTVRWGEYDVVLVDA